MRPIQIPEQNEEQIKALEKVYRTTRNVRLRTRLNGIASRGAASHRSSDCRDCTRK